MSAFCVTVRTGGHNVVTFWTGQTAEYDKGLFSDFCNAATFWIKMFLEEAYGILKNT